MLLPVTPALLKLVISKGFKYCYSKTTCIDVRDADVCITLKPVTTAPRLRSLPKAYDTFFNLCKEPAQMAAGIDRTIVLFDLDNSIIT